MSAEYVMVGGFLGAGKTTAVLRLAQHLTAKGKRVGLITNDQGQGLVDTSLLASRGYATAEITGGCFCCRFNSLTSAADRLSRDARPDVFLAEPVGSCTDLRATVQYPLRRLYVDDYRVAPLSVLVDPTRAARVLGLESGRVFSPKVVYIYQKQLEEADIIVINKIDAITDPQRQRLEQVLQLRFPRAQVVSVSARTGANFDDWFGRLSSSADGRTAMDLDYEIYAEGEALLGWLNATLHIYATHAFDGNALLRQLATRIQKTLAARDIEVAHFKMRLSPHAGDDLAVLNLVRTDTLPEAPFQLAHALTDGELVINLRAEGEPDALKETVDTALTETLQGAGVSGSIEHIEHFRPGRPVPTHRLVEP